MKIISADITGSLIINNQDVTTTVESSSIWSGSIASRVTNLEQFSSSLDATFATDQQLNQATASLSGSIALLSSSYLATSQSYDIVSGSFSVVSGSYTAASGSFSTRVTTLEEASSSLNTASGSFSTRVTTLEAASSSLNTASGSFSTRVTNNEATGSSLTTASGSFSTRVTTIESKYATTGSNTYTGPQYVSHASNAIGFTSTASLYTDGGLRVTKDAFVSGTLYLNNLTVYGTSSIQYVTSSQLNVGTNIITVNTDTPAIRFGGLSVYDSGSTGLTGSMLWDSEDNQWIYSNPSGSTYDSAVFLVGPRNSGVIGNEVGINCNFLSKGNGMHHMTSSAIFDDGSRTCFYGNSIITSTGVGCFSGAVCAASVASIGTITGTTIYGSTAICGGTVSGTTGTFSSTVTAASTVSIKGASPFIQWLNASDARLAYIQHNATNLVYNADTGTHVFNQTLCGTSAVFSSTVTGTTIYGSTAICGGTVSGTTGTFSSTISAGQSTFTVSSGTNIELNKTGGPSIQFNKTAAPAQGWQLSGEETAFKLYNTTPTTTTPFQIASTGAATFSSTVTGTTIYGSTAICGGIVSGTTGTFSSCVRAASLGIGNNISGFGNIVEISNTNANVYPRVNRSSTSYEAGWKLGTGGSDSWYIGLRNTDGVGSYHFYSYTTNSTVLAITCNGVACFAGTVCAPTFVGGLTGNASTSTTFAGAATLSGALSIGSSVKVDHWNDGGGNYMEFTGNTNATRRLRIQGPNSVGNYTQLFIDAADQSITLATSGTNRFYIGSAGTLTVSGDVIAYGSPSDISLKMNVKPIENALDKVMKLKGVSFTWKEDTSVSCMTNIKDDIGFIAQEVKEVIPELVRKNDSCLLSLRDKGIIPILVEAIKEQQCQIEYLKSKIG